MPEQRVDKMMILDAALDLVRAEGEGALSTRAVATKAGCSVQPIYSLFTDMANLIEELYDHARLWVTDYNRRHADEGANLFEANGFSHLRLAETETHLFHFLYLSEHMNANNIEAMFKSVALDGVVECIQELGHLPAEDAHRLYLNMIVYTHGLASMVACGARFEKAELVQCVDMAFHAFVKGGGVTHASTCS